MYIYEYFCIWDRNKVPGFFPIYSILGPVHGIANSLWDAVDYCDRALSEVEDTIHAPFDRTTELVKPCKCIVLKHNLDRVPIKGIYSIDKFMAEDDIDKFMTKIRYNIDITNKMIEETISFKDRDEYSWYSTLYNFSKENYNKLKNFSKGQIVQNVCDKFLYCILDIDIPDIFDNEGDFTSYYRPMICAVRTDDEHNMLLSSKDLLGNDEKFKNNFWTADIWKFEALKTEEEKQKERETSI